MRDGIVMIVCPEEDLHGAAVRDRLDELGVRNVIIDPARFPRSLRCAWRSHSRNAGAAGQFRITVDRETFETPQISGIWFRRCGLATPDGAATVDPADAHIIRSGMRHFAWGFGSLAGDLILPTVNNPRNEATARNKLVQLAAASRVGLRVPETWAGSDPADALEFVCALWERGRRVIAKVFEPPPGEAVYTRFVTPDDKAALHLLANGPAILQEYVGGGDLRISVVGHRVFPAEIQRAEACSEVDWRKAYFPRIAPTELPDTLRARLTELMAVLGLDMGMIDIKVPEDPAEEPAFLEVNPQGQFLFVEIQTGQPISAAIAELLSSGMRTRVQAGWHG